MVTAAGTMNEVQAHTAELGAMCLRFVARRARS